LLYLQWKKKQKKGTGSFPSRFNMSQDTPIQAIEKLIAPLLFDDIFLVHIKIKPTNNFKIYLDADSGLGIEKCIKINRALYKIMEEMGMYPEGDFSLEVSSPGIDEPLKLVRQYKKNIGRVITCIKIDDSIVEGQLQAVDEETINIEVTEGKGKKLIVKNIIVAFTDIKQTTVQIKF
jgi:ribosome maturation factor RimP